MLSVTSRKRGVTTKVLIGMSATGLYSEEGKTKEIKNIISNFTRLKHEMY